MRAHAPETLLLWAAALGRPLPSAPVDRERLSRAATTHRLWGALGRHEPALGAAIGPDLAAEFAARAGVQRRSLLARNLLALRQARDLALALADAGVPAVALKGLDLAFRSYPDPAARAFDDLDLLIRPSDASAAEKVLKQSGYHRVQRPERPITQALGGEAAFEAVAGAEPPALRVELHWRLHQYARYEPVLRVDVEALVADARPWPEAEPLQVLAPVDRALYLALHGGLVHGWKILPWIADLELALAELSASEAAALRHSAAAWGVAGALATGRALAGGLSGREPGRAPWCGPRLAAHLARRSVEAGTSTWRPLAGLLQLDTPAAAVTAAARAIFPPAEWRSARGIANLPRVLKNIFSCFRDSFTSSRRSTSRSGSSSRSA